MMKIEQADNSLTKGLQHFFKKLLKTREIDAFFLPVRLKDSLSIMPSLVTDPAQIDNSVPLSPAFALNSARMVSRLSYKGSGRKTAVLLRSCEIRAFIELVKLKQGSRLSRILLPSSLHDSTIMPCERSTPCTRIFMSVFTGKEFSQVLHAPAKLNPLSVSSFPENTFWI